MSNLTDSGVDAHSERIRHEYESSLSWRITRPLRRAARAVRAVRAGAALGGSGHASSRGFTSGRYDSWLEHFHREELARIDAACQDAGPEALALFRDLDAGLWTLLLTQEYEVYPNIRALLPKVPEPDLQRLWNGASGVALAAQSNSFYTKVRERYAHHGGELVQARVLDFGCGWGRVTRFFARDVGPGCLYGCDPVEAILEVCRTSGVPAKLARVDYMPRELPFDAKFDLAYAFSVFTHLSEPAHESCLQVLHDSMCEEGILVLTVRPPEYLEHCELMQPTLATLGSDPARHLDEPLYLFAPHAPLGTHPPTADGEMTYGEAVITMPYIEERWSALFEVVGIDFLADDLYQVVVTLRRR